MSPASLLAMVTTVEHMESHTVSIRTTFFRSRIVSLPEMEAAAVEWESVLYDLTNVRM